MLLQSVSARRAPSAPTFRMRAAAAFIQGRAGHVEHYASPFLPGVALWFDACRMERPRGQGGAGRKTKEGHCHGHCLADAGQDRYRHGTQNYLPTPAWSDEAAQAAHQPCRSTTVTRRAPDRSTRSAPRRPGLLLASGACRSINHGRGHASPRAHKIKEGSCRKKSAGGKVIFRGAEGVACARKEVHLAQVPVRHHRRHTQTSLQPDSCQSGCSKRGPILNQKPP